MNPYDEEHDPVLDFITKYNVMVYLTTVTLPNNEIFDDVFIEWMYSRLMELETDGYITFMQFDENGKEYESPSFRDNKSNITHELNMLDFLKSNAKLTIH